MLPSDDADAAPSAAGDPPAIVPAAGQPIHPAVYFGRKDTRRVLLFSPDWGSYSCSTPSLGATKLKGWWTGPKPAWRALRNVSFRSAGLLMRGLIIFLVIIAVLGGGGYALFVFGSSYMKGRLKSDYRTVPVAKGDVVNTVEATGTVQPIRRVAVGSFVSGPIEELKVDFNSKVRRKDVMAKIDPRIQQANLDRDRAHLATMQAEYRRVWSQRKQAISDELRSILLREKNARYISDAEMDRFRFARDGLDAQLAVAEAAVRQSQANLRLSEANVNYTEILAPEDGIVIDRKVDKGQTVAASFQTPEMFVLAVSLDEKVNVLASVVEGDIGKIREAERRKFPVEFTVDAYPDDLFPGNIQLPEQGGGIRLNPASMQNVVTYTVVVTAPNPGMKLLPGMTANLSFHIEKRTNILKIPNSALRFFPKAEQVRPEDKKLLEGEEEKRSTEQEQQKSNDAQRSAHERIVANRNRNRRHVWVQDGDLVRAVEVSVGLSDNQFTELVSGDLKENDELVTGVKPRVSQ
jgi:HlyD family secretion protein